MGCRASRPEDTLGDSPQYSAPAGGGSGGGDVRVSFLSQGGDHELFREKLFASVGEARTYADGEVVIEEGKASDAAIFIKKGTVSVKKGGPAGKEVAKRGKGDLIGEMTLLLGDVPGVSIFAEGPVETLVVQHAALTESLISDPKNSARIFKMMATTMSDRIGEASAKMRAEVVAKNASSKAPKKAPQDATTLNVNKYRQLFGLPKDAGLLKKTTCSMRKEANALKDANVQFGDLYVFEAHLCFDWKVFGFHKQQVLSLTEVMAILKSSEQPNTVEVQGKGYSYELTLPEDFEEVSNTMEAARRQTTARALQQASAQSSGNKIYEEVDSAVAEAFMASAGNKGRRESSTQANALNLDLTEEDWSTLMRGAKQRKYKKGDYVLREGAPTQAIYQILQGSLRVELQLKDQPTAVVVGHRGPGDMFGETSLLKNSPATASIVNDSEEAVLVCIEGTYLDELFHSHPKLPGRFFAFLAKYMATRLSTITETLSSNKREVAGQHLANVSIEDIFANPAYMGIFRKFMSKSQEDEPEHREAYRMSLLMFEFWMDVQDFKGEPEVSLMIELGAKIVQNFVQSATPLTCFVPEDATSLSDKMKALAEHGLESKEARRIFDAAQERAVKAIEEQCHANFLSSDHFSYIMELKAKEGIYVGLPDFRLIRVLGQGGFGQVLEVIKRDCGKHYAMKVMHKEMMRRSLGSSWRKKIQLEKDLMASLNHPFLVNLSYAFQNTEFLVLVMDLVAAGDLSEFVLTKKRLTADQVRFVVMEVVCVIGYCHQENVLYRDLKPENLLIDEHGHVRMIDMGLAARISKKQPKRRSRVGTDCYMAPEVRWAKDRKEPYGLSCDWYTIGVLTYEFSAGNVPYAHPEEENPHFRPHDFKDPDCEDLVKRLLDQDHRTRLGCGPDGISELLDHKYWRGIEWDLVPLKKFESPCKNIKGPPKRKKEKENLAVQIATDMSEAEREEPDMEYNVANWDFVSSTAVVEEYMENMYQCVSAI